MLRYLLDIHVVIYVLKRRLIEVLATFNANGQPYGDFLHRIG